MTVKYAFSKKELPAKLLTTLYDVMWCDMMWYDVMWCDVMIYVASHHGNYHELMCENAFFKLVLVAVEELVVELTVQC